MFDCIVEVPAIRVRKGKLLSLKVFHILSYLCLIIDVFIHFQLHLFVYLFIYLFIYLVIYLFIYSFIHLFIHSLLIYFLNFSSFFVSHMHLISNILLYS